MPRKEKIHFIGIGGIGVSALAQYYLGEGYLVSGSDLSPSEITEGLRALGVKISTGCHQAANIGDDVRKIICSPAVSSSNTEFVEAKRRGIPVRTYPQALGELTNKYFTIAVSGTHGKSTTTAMLSKIMVEAGLDPTVVVGTKLKEFSDGVSKNGSNFLKGRSKYLLIEADEWQASFLNYFPSVVVLTNIEEEHMDYYRDLEHILETYRKYLSQLKQDGTLIINTDDKNLRRLKPGIKNTIGYSLTQKEKTRLKNVLKIPGEHNVYNALAALTAARTLGVDDAMSLKALSKYNGCWRRFEIIENTNLKNCILITDYGHHPTEVKATLQAAREKFPQGKIWIIFQPHQLQRTFCLFDKFLEAFDDADEVILTDIYQVAGREKSSLAKKISSSDLARNLKEKGKNAYLVKNLQDVPKFLQESLVKNQNSQNIVLVVGAGDIYNLVKSFST